MSDVNFLHFIPALFWVWISVCLILILPFSEIRNKRARMECSLDLKRKGIPESCALGRLAFSLGKELKITLIPIFFCILVSLITLWSKLST